MDITKRNGSMAPFDREKIATAIKKSFISTGRTIVEDEIHDVAFTLRPRAISCFAGNEPNSENTSIR